MKDLKAIPKGGNGGNQPHTDIQKYLKDSQWNTELDLFDLFIFGLPPSPAGPQKTRATG